MGKHLISKKDKQQIKQKIKEIETKILPDLARRLQKAAKDGDIPENNAYIQIHDEIQIYRNQLIRLKETLKSAKVVKAKEDTINVGSTVTIKMQNKVKEIQIVNPVEANPLKNKISYNSPIGKLLMKKKPDQKVRLNNITIEILAVRN